MASYNIVDIPYSATTGWENIGEKFISKGWWGNIW